MRWAFIRLSVCAFAVALALGGYAYAQAQSKPMVYVAAKVEPTPVLDRIAMAESSNSHVAKNGQTRVHVNTNGTVDIGVFQINLTVWGATATKMGYNLFDEKDNRAFAKWLFENYGSEPWNSSAKNW